MIPKLVRYVDEVQIQMFYEFTLFNHKYQDPGGHPLPKFVLAHQLMYAEFN